MRATKLATAFLLGVACWVLTNCHSKVAVVCDKLDGCKLIDRSYDECVDLVETAYQDKRIDNEELTKCVDCLSFNFCDAIKKGACGDTSEHPTGDPGVCGDVVRQMRELYDDG
ncbi:MAG TPA: hypothetical protein VF103_11170 [Polyangiaceae bacterium]